MPNLNVVDEAYARSKLLNRCIDEGRRTGNSSGSITLLRDSGLVRQNSRNRTLEREVGDAYASLYNLTNYVTILDMASAFEMYAIARINTIKGDIRKLVKQNKSIDTKWAENLVHVEIKGLADICSLINIQGTDKEVFDEVKEIRNRFAHGTDITLSTKVTAEQAKAVLNRALDILDG